MNHDSGRRIRFILDFQGVYCVGIDISIIVKFVCGWNAHFEHFLNFPVFRIRFVCIYSQLNINFSFWFYWNEWINICFYYQFIFIPYVVISLITHIILNKQIKKKLFLIKQLKYSIFHNNTVDIQQPKNKPSNYQTIKN